MPPFSLAELLSIFKPLSDRGDDLSLMYSDEPPGEDLLPYVDPDEIDDGGEYDEEDEG